MRSMRPFESEAQLAAIVVDWLKGKSIITNLHEQHKTFAAAGTKGSFYTPYQHTCIQVLAYVKDHPGASLRQVVGNIQHHYRSAAGARNSLKHWIEAGKVDGVAGRIGVDGHFCLFPEGERLENAELWEAGAVVSIDGRKP